MRDASGDEFIENASTYLDVEACIDYAIMCYAVYGPDNRDKNMVLVTYDGVQWIPNYYDADCAFGLHYGGQSFYSYSSIDKSVPGNITETSMQSIKNLLLTKVVYNFFDMFVDRYWELREGILSDENIIKTFEDFEALIPQSYYDEDRRIHQLTGSLDPVDAECGEHNNSKQVAYFVRRHMASMDNAMTNIQLS